MMKTNLKPQFSPPIIVPEFSYPVDIAAIGDRWLSFQLSANPEECNKLADRFGIIEIVRLSAQVKARRTIGERFLTVEGTLTACVVQSCVVTLEAIPTDVTDHFRLVFGPIGDDKPVLHVHEIDLSPESDAPEPFEGSSLDLGEIVAQQLGLLLDPYPRLEENAPAPSCAIKPCGASLKTDPELRSETMQRPFAKLADLSRPQ